VIQIKLVKDDKDYIYTNKLVNLRHLRYTMKLSCDATLLEEELREKGLNPIVSEEMLDLYISYITSMFNNQFTEEDLEEGFEAQKLNETVENLIAFVYNRKQTKKDQEQSKKK